MKSPAVVYVCLVIGYMLTADALKCQSPQYVIIGEKGKVECEFPQQFTGIVWYDSTNTSEAVVTRLEKQENGALKVSGNGHDSGYYDMFPNGSLIIPSVAVYHDRTFKVVLIDEAFKVENVDILIITIVHPSQSIPHIESCKGEDLCLFKPKEIEYLKCMYSHGRPAVLLSWSKNDGGRAKTLHAQFTTTSDGQYTFESILTVNVSGLVQAPLHIFTCEASGPALDFEIKKASVLIFNFDQEEMKQNKTNRPIPQQQVGLQSHLEIFCTHTKPIAFVWTFERYNISSIVAISANGKMKLIDSLNDTLDVSLDGTINVLYASDHLEGIFTCIYLESNTSSFAMVQVVIKNEVGWLIPVVTVILVVAFVGGLLFITYYVHQTLWIRFVPSTLDGLLTCSTKITQSILSWPLYEQNDSVVFNEDGIQLLRNVSKDIEENRHKKNAGVIGGALTSIAGAAIAIAGVLLPIAGSVLIFGIVVGAAGTVVNIGSSVLQMLNDNDKRAKVKPSLKTFIDFQKNLAVTTNNLAIVFNLMEKLKKAGKCKQKSISHTVISQMKEIFKKLQNEHRGLMLQDRLQLASEGTTDMLKILEEEIINSPFNEAISMQGSNLSDEISNARELPFGCLPTSIKTLVKTTNPKRGKPTILTLIIILYVDTSDRNVNVANVGPGGASVRAAAAGRGVDGAINLTSRGILVGNRLILKSLDLSDDAIRLTNFMKIAKAVSVSGIILSAIGVVVDVAFLGHAVLDEMKDEKSESAQSMLDIANVMEEINQLSSRKLKLAP